MKSNQDSPKLNPCQRKIIHIDMDAFFASVEQRDFPEFQGKPIVVGGSPEGRGVVAAASYESRKFGIRSAMSSRKAIQLCPDLIFVKPRFEQYKRVSMQIRQIFKRYTDLIEPLSLDEAYLDVTVDKKGIGSAIQIAQEIRKAIKQELNLTASAGVSVNKFLAKVASDINKPDGMKFIGPHQIEEFMEVLPIEKFYGVGKVTSEKMKTIGILTGADLKNFSRQQLKHYFGKQGNFFYNIVRGIDDRPVQPDRVIKSLGAEDTFPVDLNAKIEMEEELRKITQKLILRLKKHPLKGKTVTVKIRFSDFSLITRSKTFSTGLDSFEQVFPVVLGLLHHSLFPTSDISQKKVRLLGVSLSNFSKKESQSRQLSFFS